ncbi:MAG: hypothetical protein U0703_01125 [Anaerolineae bacterium]
MSDSSRSSTTVLAMDTASPSTSPALGDQPQSCLLQPQQRGEYQYRAPGMAMCRTVHKSLSEKCRPTPNIMKMTPISASWLAAGYPRRSRA